MWLAHAPPVPAPTTAAPLLDPESSGALQTVKRLIWLYFWLLIFEGALRKWILPGWSNPLLLVRDPVVVLIYLFAIIANVFPRSGFVVATGILAAVSLVASEVFGRGNLLVTLYGFRTSFLHLPLIFLIPNVFNREDVNRMAKWILITSIPMCLLVLAQFRAAPTDWVNYGVSGTAGAQLEAGFGKIRPPGTFSFTAVLVSYLSVAAAFAMHPLMRKDAINTRLATAALPALAVMVGISGSRSALGAVTIIVIAVLLICLKKPVFFGRGMKIVVLLGAAYFALSFWTEFQQGLEIHQERIVGGGGFKDGILIRTLSEFIEPFTAMLDTPFFGVGLGMGTNGASGFLYGRVVFNLGESEWGRIVRESGPILGFAYVGLRIAIVVHLAKLAFKALDRDNPLPMLTLAATFLPVLSGQFGVPSLLGFAVFNAGLCLASNVLTGDAAAPVPLPSDTPTVPLPVVPAFRGRSVYAEELHGEIEDPDIARFGP